MSITSRGATELAASLATDRGADIVDPLNRSKPAFEVKLLESLPEAQAVDALDQPQLERSAAILSALPPERAARLLDLMSADRSADAVREMRISVRNDLLARVSPETKASLDHLLPYPEGCTGHIMTTEFVAVPANWTIGEVLDHIRAVEHTRETVYAIYLVDPQTGVLLRAVALRQLISADTRATVLNVAPTRAPTSVTPETPEGETVRLISKYNLLAIPVVDASQHVIGIVTVDDAVDTLVAQQDAEVQNFGGMEALDAPYMHVGFLSMIKKRAGWLCVLFIAEMLTASAMQSFEDELEKAVVLVVGSMLPFIAKKLGFDPATASAPFVATFVDVTGIVIYFTVATLILRGTML